MAASGQLVRALTIGFRYVIRGGRGRRVYAEDLVTDGVYAHVRNPMYVGNLLIVLGVAIAANSWPTIWLGVPMALFMYICIVAAEEQYLLGRFGDAFKALLPGRARCAATAWRTVALGRAMRFRWRLVLVKRTARTLGWVSVIIAVTLFNFCA